MKIYNTLTRQKEEFVPLNPPKVTMYTCGPTVYDFAHIGNLRAFTMSDLLQRTFKYLGYDVETVMNVTDVGQLESDEDFGEDKIMIGVEREKEKGNDITVWDLAKRYTDKFLEDIKSMNIIPADHITPATKHIPEMIDLVKILVEKGYAYVTPQAIYFDVTKFSTYTELSGQKLEDKKALAREELVNDPNKKNPFDFRIWQLDRPEHAMLWDSPWGKGFPGWHIECSAMSMKYLGKTIDIHLGGVDHIPVHHTNEIAQSEAATGKKFVRYWMHSEFLRVDNAKMSKSKRNFYSVNDIIEKGFDPLDLRYLYLEAQYRFPQNFTWEAMESARNARQNIREQVQILKYNLHGKDLEKIDISEHPLRLEFESFVSDDLNIPGALSVLWKVLRSNELSDENKMSFLLNFDSVFGLKLDEVKTIYDVFSEEEVENIMDKLNMRDEAKNKKDWDKADEIRDLFAEEEIKIIDTSTGATPIYVGENASLISPNEWDDVKA